MGNLRYFAFCRKLLLTFTAILEVKSPTSGFLRKTAFPFLKSGMKGGASRINLLPAKPVIIYPTA